MLEKFAHVFPAMVTPMNEDGALIMKWLRNMPTG